MQPTQPLHAVGVTMFKELWDYCANADNFEVHAHQFDSGVEYWLARDVQHLLGYDQWRNFSQVISKAKVACEVSGHEVSDHFADVSKMVDLGSEGRR